MVILTFYLTLTPLLSVIQSRPFITGHSFGTRDENGLYHLDGAFSGLFQVSNPQSKSERRRLPLLLPWSFGLLLNGLNMLLSHDRATRFWEEGYLTKADLSQISCSY
jgi:hypothetical protein